MPPATTYLWKETYRAHGERLQRQSAAATNTRWYTGKPQDRETGCSVIVIVIIHETGSHLAGGNIRIGISRRERGEAVEVGGQRRQGDLLGIEAARFASTEPRGKIHQPGSKRHQG